MGNTQLYCILLADLKKIAEILNQCLEAVEGMWANKLKLNPDKVEVLLVTGRSDPGFQVLVILGVCVCSP